MSSPRGDIFVLYCCHGVQQKRPNENPLFARIFIGLTMAETEGFCRVKLDLCAAISILDFKSVICRFQK